MTQRRQSWPRPGETHLEFDFASDPEPGDRRVPMGGVCAGRDRGRGRDRTATWRHQSTVHLGRAVRAGGGVLRSERDSSPTRTVGVDCALRGGIAGRLVWNRSRTVGAGAPCGSGCVPSQHQSVPAWIRLSAHQRRIDRADRVGGLWRDRAVAWFHRCGGSASAASCCDHLSIGHKSAGAVTVPTRRCK